MASDWRKSKIGNFAHSHGEFAEGNAGGVDGTVWSNGDTDEDGACAYGHIGANRANEEEADNRGGQHWATNAHRHKYRFLEI